MLAVPYVTSFGIIALNQVSTKPGATHFTPHKLKARQQQLDHSITRYLSELNRADRDPSLVIVAHEVVNEGHDRSQLTAMAQQTKATLQTDNLKVLADQGYFSGEEIMKCEQAGVIPLVPKPLTNNAATTGRFDKRDFHYDAKRDRYRCPAGEHVIRRFTSIQKGMEIRKYWSPAYPKCAIHSDCTTSDYRRLMRWEHEAVIERMPQRLDRMPQARRL